MFYLYIVRPDFLLTSFSVSQRKILTQKISYPATYSASESIYLRILSLCYIADNCYSSDMSVCTSVLITKGKSNIEIFIPGASLYVDSLKGWTCGCAYIPVKLMFLLQTPVILFIATGLQFYKCPESSE